MSATELPSEVEIRERSEKTVKCPPEIGKQLQEAAFEPVNAQDGVTPNQFKKTRPSFGREEPQSVVTAKIENGKLTITAQDIVGIINLTPSSKLRIRPKIEWDQVLKMFLTVERYNRSPEYHGIPLDDFLADDTQIEDIFIIIAFNYLNSLQSIHQEGFIRDFSTSRTDAVSSRGRIDVERSLLNMERGIPKHHFVRKDIEYDVPANSLIHRAGKILLQLFQEHTSENSHDEYYRIFSAVNDEIQYLESLGINSRAEDLAKYRRVNKQSIPRQRSYYDQAVTISKTILSSSTGQSLESGEEELTMDYIIDMESLFEEFSQVSFENELEKFQSNRLYHGLDEITIKDEPTVHPYVGEQNAWYHPDHVVYHADTPIAVVDSKYVPSDTDPSLNKKYRNQIFSYGLTLNVSEMGFICPFGSSKRRLIRSGRGAVSVLRPGNTFTVEKFQTAIREYLESEVLADYVEEDEFSKHISQFAVASSGLQMDRVEDVLTSSTLVLDGTRLGIMAYEINQAVIDLSSTAPHSRNLKKKRRRKINNLIKDTLEDYVPEFDYVVPLFVPSKTNTEICPEDMEEWNGDMIICHFLVVEGDEVIETKRGEPIPLEWQ